MSELRPFRFTADTMPEPEELPVSYLVRCIQAGIALRDTLASALSPETKTAAAPAPEAAPAKPEGSAFSPVNVGGVE